jgi:uncharacterized protein YceK
MMKNSSFWAVWVVVLMSTLSGCGTVTNLNSNSPIPYGGVEADLDRCKNVWEPNLPHGWFPGELVLVTVAQAAIFSFNVLDLPASAIGDTLTLPFVGNVPVSPPAGK